MINRWFYKLGQFAITYKNLFFLSFIPCGIIVFIFFVKYQKIQSYKKEIELISNSSNKTKWSREAKKLFLNRYQAFDPYFINKNIESLNFKKREIDRINNLLKNPAFKTSEKLKKRLQKLSVKNKLSFKQLDVNSNSFLIETLEKQKEKIEVDKEDIKRILSLIEGITISTISSPKNSPLMIIENFELIQKKDRFFLDNVSFVKREFRKGKK